MLDLGRPSLNQTHSLLKRETSGQPTTGKSINYARESNLIFSDSTAETFVRPSTSCATPSATEAVTQQAGKLASRPA